MEINWVVEEKDSKQLKYFLKRKGVSKRLLTKVKFRDGQFLVNNKPVRVTHFLKTNDKVTMVLPMEKSNSNLIPSDKELDILFEDEHFLIVNKPAGIYSVPAPSHWQETMANRVKGYIERNKYSHQTIHVVSRLDRDTSGVMIFAKHTYAHSLMDELLKNKLLDRYYSAIVKGSFLKSHSIIDAPIAREKDSIIERVVDKSGKASLTEFWVTEKFKDFTRVRIQLHTGRTHQIRVHFSYKNHPLLGDKFYGSEDPRLSRQALHCEECDFIHPLTKKPIQIKAPLPDDLTRVINNMRSEREIG